MRILRNALFLSLFVLLLPVVVAAQQKMRKFMEHHLPTTGLYMENRGQWDEGARYLFRAPSLDLWITDRGMIYDVQGREEGKGQVVALTFVGGNRANPQGSGSVKTSFSYFHGADPRGWVSGAPGYSSVRMEIYHGIDAYFYAENGLPRYDLVVAPGTDPRKVTMRVEGAERVVQESDGTLKIITPHGDISHAGLVAYQLNGCIMETVLCRFEVRDNGTVGLDIGEYDRSRLLIVDPLIFSTVISGDSRAEGLAVGPDNASYITGVTSNATFPTTVGAYDRGLNGSSDVMVAKLKADGSGLVYATYIGGAQNEEGNAIAVDAQGNAYITGETFSTDYPTTNGAYDLTAGSQEAFVTKLNPTGTALVYSTFIGGSNSENGEGIAVDRAGNVYVAGSTSSDNFPTTVGAYDRTFNGIADAFVVKLNPAGSAALYSTVIGGDGFDNAYGLVVDGQGNAYITGQTFETTGPKFPVTQGAVDMTHNGRTDAFVTIFDAAGKNLISSTLLGGAESDAGNAIALDSSRNIYVTGSTGSPSFPTTSGAYDMVHNGDDDFFVTRLGPNGASLEYSTFVGGSRYDYGTGIAVDPFGNACVTGHALSWSFPTTPDALDRTSSDSGDVVLLKLDRNGEKLLYSTLYGGKFHDIGTGIALDGNGGLYVGGYTYSTDFPTTPGAFDESKNAAYDPFVLKIDLPSPPSIVLEYPLGGEGLCAGTTQTIRWRSTSVASVKIELSSDAGATYPTVLVANTPGAAGAWAWAIPKNLPMLYTYRIRISDASGGGVIDESNQSFMIETAPTIISQSDGINTICLGDPLVLNASATGSGRFYVWRRNGLRLQGQTDSVLRILSTTRADSGVYDAIVSGPCAPADTSAPMRVVIVPETAVTLAPPSLGVCLGDTIRLQAQSSGGNLTYVWRHDGAVLPGATAATLELPAGDASDAGAYDVIAVGLCGPPDTSAVSEVRVMREPAIAGPLAWRVVGPGTKVWFVFPVTGDSLTYQWRKNGNDIPGAVAASMVIDSVTVLDSGFYSLVVTNPCGVVISDPSRLDVDEELEPSAVPDDRARASLGVGRAFSIPHPARGTTRISVKLPAGVLAGAGTALHLFDTEGRLAADLTESFSRHEYREAILDADALPSGVYTCRLQLRGVEIPLGAIVVVR